MQGEELNSRSIADETMELLFILSLTKVSLAIGETVKVINPLQNAFTEFIKESVRIRDNLTIEDVQQYPDWHPIKTRHYSN